MSTEQSEDLMLGYISLCA